MLITYYFPICNLRRVNQARKEEMVDQDLTVYE